MDKIELMSTSNIICRKIATLSQDAAGTDRENTGWACKIV